MRSRNGLAVLTDSPTRTSTRFDSHKCDGVCVNAAEDRIKVAHRRLLRSFQLIGRANRSVGNVRCLGIGLLSISDIAVEIQDQSFVPD